jgi:uncharacterized YkwD family protein
MRKVWLTLLVALAVIIAAGVPVAAANDNWNWVREGCQNGNDPAIIQPTDPSISQPTEPASKPGFGNDAKATAADLTAAETLILKQVNAERAKAGLAPLTIDYRLVQTARAKSQDMIDNGYFDHESPVLGSPFDQMKRAGITYRYAGENIAGNSSAAGAMESWMESPGHRANILNSDFTRIGIGVVDGGPYGKMMTQQFAG